MRKYPHIDDFELTVEEGEGWLSKHWDKALLAEQRPRGFLDWWLGCEWENLSKDGYRESEKIYNPKQLINFIEQYFNNSELVECITRGKHDGYSDSLATKHYGKALGYAIKLREEVPDFPQTPDAIGKPHLDLRKLHEWCIECEKNIHDLYMELILDGVEEALSLLQELRELLKSGTPPIDKTKWDRIRNEIWSELERLLKVIDESGKSTRYWHNRVMFGQDCELFLNKLAEHKIHAPDNKEELVEILTAAEWMAKVDWNKVKAIEEEQKSGKDPDITSHQRIEQMSLLGTAQIAEQKIHELTLRAYCHENQNFNEAVGQVQERKTTLFNDAAEVLNSDAALLKIVYLRDEKLITVYKSLDDCLFNTSTQRSDGNIILQEIIDELEAIRDDAKKYDVFTKPAETEQKIKPVKDSKKTKIYCHSIPIPELITQGESHTVEFKETLQYNIQTKQPDSKVFNSSLKTIAAFLNADGGTLLIGVSDSGEIRGIERDRMAMGRTNNDKFELRIRNAMSGQNSRFTPGAMGKVNILFEELDEGTICRVDVKPLLPSETQHFDNEVYIRDGNQTIKLTGSDLNIWMRRRN